jgi:hypothetical protein
MTSTNIVGASGFLFMSSLLPLPAPVDAGVASLSFGFLSSSGGGGVAVGAADGPIAQLSSFGFLGGKLAATPATVAAVGGGMSSFSFLSGGCSSGSSMVIATAETFPTQVPSYLLPLDRRGQPIMRQARELFWHSS